LRGPLVTGVGYFSTLAGCRCPSFWFHSFWPCISGTFVCWRAAISSIIQLTLDSRLA
jgi:hypothetical protein